jgi:hypothetical protein
MPKRESVVGVTVGVAVGVEDGTGVDGVAVIVAVPADGVPSATPDDVGAGVSVAVGVRDGVSVLVGTTRAFGTTGSQMEPLPDPARPIAGATASASRRARPMIANLERSPGRSLRNISGTSPASRVSLDFAKTRPGAQKG